MVIEKRGVSSNCASAESKVNNLSDCAKFLSWLNTVVPTDTPIDKNSLCSSIFYASWMSLELTTCNRVAANPVSGPQTALLTEQTLEKWLWLQLKVGVVRLFQLSGIFTYPASLWNNGVWIIEVLLYVNWLTSRRSLQAETSSISSRTVGWSSNSCLASSTPSLTVWGQLLQSEQLHMLYHGWWIIIRNSLWSDIKLLNPIFLHPHFHILPYSGRVIFKGPNFCGFRGLKPVHENFTHKYLSHAHLYSNM